MSVLAYYRAYKPFRGSFAFALARLGASSYAERLSWSNRIADYLALQKHPDLLPLHSAINEVLEGGAATWPHYDYGEGYFYQSCQEVGVSGLRDTAARIAAFDLRGRLAGKVVLNIGCNSGFLDIGVAGSAAHVTGMDVNPHLVRIAQIAADHLRITNCTFITSSFEEAPITPSYDVVLSFANHSTFDGLTRHTLDQYFSRCVAALACGGTFLFESHAPAYEGDGLRDVLALIGEHFVVEDVRVLYYGTYLDSGRTFVAARRR